MKKDTLFDKMRAYAYHLLRFKKKNKKTGKYDLNEIIQKKLFDYVHNNFKDWDDDFLNHCYRDNRLNREIKLKMILVKEWVSTSYKNKQYISGVNKIYYNKNRGDKMTNKEHLQQVHKDITDTNYKKVLDGYNECIEQGIKPIIPNVMEKCGLSKNTVNKYLKQIKSEIKEYIKGEKNV